MEHFDFDAPADVFVGEYRRGRNQRMTYRRFQRGAHAIRYAMEGQAAEKLAGTIVEADESRFGAAEIRSLYESDDCPLPHRRSN